MTQITAQIGRTSLLDTFEAGRAPSKELTVVDGVAMLDAIERELETGENDAISPDILFQTFGLVQHVKAFSDRFDTALAKWREIEYNDIQQNLKGE